MSPRILRQHVVCLLLGLVVLAGCGSNVCLVSDVPPPPFGARCDARPEPSAEASAERSPAGFAQWIPASTERRWRYIIVHHSATESGGAATFDQMHRARGWDELGYHFVIGNGTETGDGQLEIGPRWHKQKHGAHCKVSGHAEYNELGIGICLVGNFNDRRPSEAQMRTLARLTHGLMQRYGIPKSRILGHGMLAPTDCPGKQFDFRDLYRRL